MSDRIKAMRQRKADMVSVIDALADKRAKGEKLSDEDAARLAAIAGKDGDLDQVNADIALEERMMDERRTMEAASNINGDTARETADRRQQAQQPAARFASLGEQMLAVARASRPGAVRDSRLHYTTGVGDIQAATGMSEGIAADGGFLVQTDFQAELLQNVYALGEIAKRIRKISVGPNSNGIAMNGVDETSRANGSRWGGIQSFWTGEAGLKTASQPKFRRIKMELDKLTGLCYATDELLQDSVALQEWLKQAFADEFTFKVEDAIVNGSGSGMPLGILNSGAVITVNKEGSQAAATITANNILAMWARLPAMSQRDAVWLVNVDTAPQLASLYTTIKNVAGTENVGGIASVGVSYTPPGANGNPFATLMGRPVIPCEYCATLGTAGDIILADLGQYLGIDKGATESASSIHVRFIYDETTFRFVYRFNGMPLWRTAMTPYKGSNTLSPFIVLQTR